ncbi:PepSY domain-containing protein [uncultured Lamprocystis sp.]|uniref:PepSY domain-containing protein n=1 Tax=uncultured Lamprocystis sp. TaxID=543132 RepID=UPI0025D540A2|nr:PepSY domain-containing protein [uncultured Lamprocystis sp.]
MAGTFEIATRTAAASQAVDLFGVALRLHKDLLIGAGLLVEIATYAMVALLIAGLVFGAPKLRNTLGGWHRGIGWFAFPLVARLPVTGLLMTLHVGKLIAAVALIGLTVTGLYSWLRRRPQQRRIGRVSTEQRSQALRLASSIDPKRSTVS